MILLHKLGRPSTMIDSVDISQIPADAKVVGCYADGNFANLPAAIRRFQGKADIVTFGIFLGHLADFTDVEPGNPINTPALVRADFEHRKAHGVWRPGFYADRTRMATQVFPGLAGIPRSEYRLLLADWTNLPHITPGFDGDQYESLNHPNIDISRLAPSFFPPGSIHGPKRRKHPIKRVYPVVKKVPVVVPAGGGATGLAAILSQLAHVHLTPTEWAALGAVLTALAGAIESKAKGK